MPSKKGSETSRPSSGRGESSGDSRSAARERTSGAALSFWVTTQGHEVKIHSGSEMPSRTPAEGENTIDVEGPYPTADAAERRASLLRQRSPMYVGSSEELVR